MDKRDLHLMGEQFGEIQARDQEQTTAIVAVQIDQHQCQCTSLIQQIVDQSAQIFSLVSDREAPQWAQEELETCAHKLNYVLTQLKYHE